MQSTPETQGTPERQDAPENAGYTRDDALKRTTPKRKRRNSDEISTVAIGGARGGQEGAFAPSRPQRPPYIDPKLRRRFKKLVEITEARKRRQNSSASGEGKEVPSDIREEALNLKRERMSSRKIERNSSALGEGKEVSSDIQEEALSRDRMTSRKIGRKSSASGEGKDPMVQIGSSKKKLILKWMFALLNVVLELWQAVISQEAGDGKTKGTHYRKLSVILSSICLYLSLLELLEEAMRDGVKWRRNRGCYCLRYPGKHGRIFGRFSLWFGLLSATVQFSLNLASLVIKRGVLKFDHLGLLLSVGYCIAAIVGEHAKMVANVKCSSHGKNEAEGKLVEGLWEFECPHCSPEKMA